MPTTMQILILSDIHANHVALQTVISKAGHFDRIWCLGDVVGYGPEPNECIETLRSFDLLCLAGNHDWAVLGKLDLEEFNPDARRAAMWTREQLTPSSLEWLRQLSERVSAEGKQFTLVHGSPRYPIWEYVLTPAVARVNFELFDTPVCLFGHTHIPVVYRYGPEQNTTAEPLIEAAPLAFGPEKMMINPGSVGQPRDGDPRSAFAVINLERKTLTHYRVDYDIRATQAKMQSAHLPQRLITRLSHGW